MCIKCAGHFQAVVVDCVPLVVLVLCQAFTFPTVAEVSSCMQHNESETAVCKYS